MAVRKVFLLEVNRYPLSRLRAPAALVICGAHHGDIGFGARCRWFRCRRYRERSRSSRARPFARSLSPSSRTSRRELFFPPVRVLKRSAAVVGCPERRRLLLEHAGDVADGDVATGLRRCCRVELLQSCQISEQSTPLSIFFLSCRSFGMLVVLRGCFACGDGGRRPKACLTTAKHGA